MNPKIDVDETRTSIIIPKATLVRVKVAALEHGYGGVSAKLIREAIEDKLKILDRRQERREKKNAQNNGGRS